jgi:hypothetical protein
VVWSARNPQAAQWNAPRRGFALFLQSKYECGSGSLSAVKCVSRVFWTSNMELLFREALHPTSRRYSRFLALVCRYEIFGTDLRLSVGTRIKHPELQSTLRVADESGPYV